MKQNTHSGLTMVELLVTVFVLAIVVIGLGSLVYYFISNTDLSFDQTRSLNIAQQGVSVLTSELREVQDGEEGSYPLQTVDDLELVFNSDVDNDGLAERVRYYLVGDSLVKQVFNLYPGGETYVCQDSCEICHQGTDTITIPEQAWPAHYGHGDTLGDCGGGSPTPSPTGDEASAYETYIVDHLELEPGEAIFSYYNGDWPGDTVNNPLVQSERLLETRYIEVFLPVRVDEGSFGAQRLVLEGGVHLRNLKDNL